MLIFLSNELINPEVQRKYKLKLNFISFAFVEGIMFRQHQGNDKKTMNLKLKDTKARNNVVIYGALFWCDNFDFYSSILDGMHNCMTSILGFNHAKSEFHREEVMATVIHFETLQQLANLEYKELTQVETQAYFANINHPKIRNKVLGKKASDLKIVDGIDANNYTKLFLEVTKNAKSTRNRNDTRSVGRNTTK